MQNVYLSLSRESGEDNRSAAGLLLRTHSVFFSGDRSAYYEQSNPRNSIMCQNHISRTYLLSKLVSIIKKVKNICVQNRRGLLFELKLVSKAAYDMYTEEIHQ